MAPGSIANGIYARRSGKADDPYRGGCGACEFPPSGYCGISARQSHLAYPRSMRIGWFSQLPGVRGAGDRYVVVTGRETHYLRAYPSIPDCPFHNWTGAQATGFPAPPSGPIVVQSTNPGRVWFPDGSQHHCAHLRIEAINRILLQRQIVLSACQRSARELCKADDIRGFEQHLCCRTCNFEPVCGGSVPATLPPTTGAGDLAPWTPMDLPLHKTLHSPPDSLRSPSSPSSEDPRNQGFGHLPVGTPAYPASLPVGPDRPGPQRADPGAAGW